MDLDDDELRKTRVEKGLEEKNADEMFEDFGYEKKDENKNEALLIQYVGKDNIIRFWADGTVDVGDIDNNSGYMTMQELQAINKKVEELRMDKISEELKKQWIG